LLKRNHRRDERSLLFERAESGLARLCVLPLDTADPSRWPSLPIEREAGGKSPQSSQAILEYGSESIHSLKMPTHGRDNWQVASKVIYINHFNGQCNPASPARALPDKHRGELKSIFAKADQLNKSEIREIF
jgi:hypothetical protein